LFLNCNGFRNHPQTDCRTYAPNGELNYANRYAARSLSFDLVEIKDSFNNTKIFSDFVKIVNMQSSYNRGKINALPLLIFHNVALVTNRPYYTNAELFDQLMKYLYKNHFRVLTYKQLKYNTQTNTFYLNESNPANLTRFYNVDMTGMNGIVPKQYSAIKSNTAVAPLSSNMSYLFHPTSLINHSSVPTTSTSSASSDSSGNTGHHLHRFSASTSASVSSDSSGNTGHHLHSSYGKDHPNGESSKHHGGYCSYSDYKSNLIRCT
jgi:hypothetical protein